MKQVKINSLLDTPKDGVTYQKEWTIVSRLRGNGLFLLIALFAGNIGPGLFMISYLSKFYIGDYFEFGFMVAFFVVLFGYAIPHLFFLGKPGRFWRAMLKPQSSWISRGFIFANVFLLFSFLAIAHNIPFLDVGPLRTDSSFYEMYLFGGLIFSFLISIYPGFIFSKVRAIPFWNSLTLIPLFLVQSFGSGIALSLILVHLPGISDPGMADLLPFEALFITISAILLTGYIYGRYKSGKAGKASVELLVYGRYKGIFLIGAISFEIIIPLVMVSLTFIGLDLQILIFAEFIQLGGIFFFKFCLLNVGGYNSIFRRSLFGTLTRSKRTT